MKRPLRIVVESGETPPSVRVTARDQRRDAAIVDLERDATDSGADLPRVVHDALVDALSQLRDAPRSDVEVVLRPPLAQLRTLVDLPPVSSRDLVSLVENQRDRFFRKGQGETLVGARWAQPGDTQPRAMAASAELALAQSIEDAFSSSRHSMCALLVGGADGAVEVPLWPASLRERLARRRRRLMAGVVVLAAAGWLAPATVYVADLLLDHRALQVEITAMAAPLATIDSLERRISDFGDVARAYERQGPDSAWATTRLAELVASLPATVHFHAVSLTRSGTTRVVAHSDDQFARDSVVARWPLADAEVGDSGEVVLRWGAAQ